MYSRCALQPGCFGNQGTCFLGTFPRDLRFFEAKQRNWYQLESGNIKMCCKLDSLKILHQWCFNLLPTCQWRSKAFSALLQWASPCHGIMRSTINAVNAQPWVHCLRMQTLAQPCAHSVIIGRSLTLADVSLLISRAAKIKGGITCKAPKIVPRTRKNSREILAFIDITSFCFSLVDISLATTKDERMKMVTISMPSFSNRNLV